MRKLLLLSILFFIPLAQAEAKDKQHLTLKAELIITGEIVQEACTPNLSKSRQSSTQQIIKTLSDNCIINGPSSHSIPRVKVAAFTPTAKNQTPESTKTLEKYSFFISEYI